MVDTEMINFREIEKWYWAGLPDVKSVNPLSKQHQKMIIDIRNIVGLEAKNIAITAENTAYTDLKTVFIPEMYLNWGNVEQVAVESVYGDFIINESLTNKQKLMVILSIYHTFFIHENYHIQKTKYLPVGKTKAWFRLFNTFEDMYINKLAMNTSMSMFYKIMYSVFYNQNLITSVEKYEKNEEKSLDGFADYFFDVLLKLNYDYIINGYKEKLNIELPDVLTDDDKNRYKNFYNAFQKLLNQNDFERRIGIVDLAYNFIEPFLSKEDKQEQELKDEDGDVLHNSFMDYFSNEHNKDVTDKTYVRYSLRDVLESEQDNETFENSKTSSMPRDFNLAKTMTILSVDEYPINKTIKPNDDMRQFAHYMRYQWGIQKQKVNAHKHGAKINNRHIQNVKTTGAIFRKGREEQDTMVKTQAIFLVDFSGSMISIIGDVMSAVYGVSLGLQSIGFNHSIWGHTCKNMHEYKHHPVLYNIFNFGMKNVEGKIVYDNDLETCINKSLSINKTGNEDYIALTTVSKYFQGHSKRNLFVLSDGSPSPERGGNIGFDATVESVKKLRKDGISVYSLSLTPNVMKDNNEIYGEKYNFAAYGVELTNSLKLISEMLGKEK